MIKQPRIRFDLQSVAPKQRPEGLTVSLNSNLYHPSMVSEPTSFEYSDKEQCLVYGLSEDLTAHLNSQPYGISAIKYRLNPWFID
jgi:hypothetical protein